MPRGVRNNPSDAAKSRAKAKQTAKQKTTQKHPKFKYDWEVIDKHLSNGCSGIQVAAAIGLGSPDALYWAVQSNFGLTFSEYRQQKLAKGEASLLNAQHELALDKNPMMLIWLGKNRLQQRDTPVEIEVSKESIAQFKAFNDQLKEIQEKAKDE